MMNATRDFANLLLARTKHDLWIQSLPNEKDTRGGSHTRTRDVDRIVRFCQKHDVPGFGVYYCVSSIDGPKRSIETVGETPIVWFDIDFKDIKATPEQALEVVKALEVPPTRIHASGNGLHGIYILTEPIAAGENIRTVLRRLADIVGGDLKVCQPAALMRMPGTHNSKRGEWKLVTVIKSGPEYQFDDLKKFVTSGTRAVAIERIAGAAKGASSDPFKRLAEEYDFRPPIDAEARLRAMEHGGPGRHRRAPDAAAGHRKPAGAGRRPGGRLRPGDRGHPGDRTAELELGP
jgi:hypothetical protein